MQIKRFEAADMAEALRMVKREFGDDAVILSAKELRPGGFFSALRKKSVEITAAADYPVDDARAGNEFSGLLSKHLDAESENDRVSISSPFQTVKPYVADNDRVAEPFYRDVPRQKVIALVGPPGVGKSTTVAKLARHCKVVEKRRTGLISLDRFRIGANGMLENVARIMNLPLTIVHDADQMQSALNDLSDVDVVLIDTPGMSSMDPSMVEDVCELLRLAEPDETHLVANATVRDEVLAAAVKTFLPIGVDHLLFTHMDEYGGSATVLNLLKETRLPSSFFGDGVDLFDHLQETTVDGLGGFSPHIDPPGGLVTVLSRNRGQKKSGSVLNDISSDSIHYVANRNSELFHHPNCKSVKRINVQNIAAFNSVEQAMEEGFKPCRACCGISMIRKSVTGALGHQRVSAI